jgi:large subunit ribosomal protein L21
MYAIIQTGGKQYRVQPGDTVHIEKLPGEAGSAVEFDQVLLLSDSENVAVGRPLIQDAKVTGEIVSHGRGKKIIVFKFHRRKDYRRKNGHRQSFTAVKINNIVTP